MDGQEKKSCLNIPERKTRGQVTGQMPPVGDMRNSMPQTKPETLKTGNKNTSSRQNITPIKKGYMGNYSCYRSMR